MPRSYPAIARFRLHSQPQQVPYDGAFPRASHPSQDRYNHILRTGNSRPAHPADRPGALARHVPSLGGAIAVGRLHPGTRYVRCDLELILVFLFLIIMGMMAIPPPLTFVYYGKTEEKERRAAVRGLGGRWSDPQSRICSAGLRLTTPLFIQIPAFSSASHLKDPEETPQHGLSFGTFEPPELASCLIMIETLFQPTCQAHYAICGVMHILQRTQGPSE